MADERITLRRETVEALAEMLDNEAQGYARVTQSRNVARRLREDAGERFYPEPPKPAPERVGAVAKRVRDGGAVVPHEDVCVVSRNLLARLLACAEASDAWQRGGFNPYDEVAWRRIVAGETT